MSRYCSNTNQRGSSYDRRARKLWLLSPVSGHGGDGEKAPCWECGAMVCYKTMIVDRIVPASQGGRYIRSNIRIHCCVCSCREGFRRGIEATRLADPYGDDDLCKSCGVHFLDDHRQGCRNLPLLASGW